MLDNILSTNLRHNLIKNRKVNKIKISKETQSIFLIFGTILVLCISSIICLSNVSLGTINSEVNQFEPRPKNAGYWNLTKIFVDDFDPNYDWNHTASTYGWCSGNGTWGDPYIIENVYIDGQFAIPETPGKIHSKNCISIYNSVKPFIIRNCTILKSGLGEYNSGVYLRTVRNGVVFNNTINYCSEGVYVDWYSRNITIAGNRFISDNVIGPYTRAIFVSFLGHNTTIYDNYFFDYYECIAVINSDGCIVEQNFLDNTYMNYAGIIFSDSDYGKVLNNTFAGSLALYLYSEFVVNQSDCTGTIVENNTIQIITPEGSGPQGSGPQISGGGFSMLVNLMSSDYTHIIDNLLILEVATDGDDNGDGDGDGTIHGYDIAILIGIIGVSVLLLKRTSKKK